MLKRIWKDPVGSKIIAAIIIATLGAIVSSLLGWWPNIKGFFISILGFLNSELSIKYWVFGILLIPCVICLLIITALIKEKLKSSRKPWDYKEDHFFNLRWTWKYLGSEIYDMYSFCPKCAYQLFPILLQKGTGNIVCRFNCEECGWHAPDIPGTPQEIEHRIVLKIQQNLRTGKWQQILKKDDLE